MTRQQFFKLAGFGTLAAIFVLSLLPGPDVPNIPGSDKLHHALAYFACMYCWGQAYSLPVQRLRFAIGLIATGVLIEYMQYFTPTRSFDFLDMVANTSGVITAWLVVTVQMSIERRWFSASASGEPLNRR